MQPRYRNLCMQNELFCYCCGIAVILAVIFGAFGATRRNARESICIRNTKMLEFGLLQYAQDWDATLPPASQWATLISKYISKPAVWHCPEASSPYSYALNKAADRVSLGTVIEPRTTVSLFEADATVPNAVGDWKSVVTPGRHDESEAMPPWTTFGAKSGAGSPYGKQSRKGFGEARRAVNQDMHSSVFVRSAQEA